jgi:ABC-2 type transport system permease protein
MRKTLVIAAREYRAAVRTKSFLISLILLPVLMVASVGIQVVIELTVEHPVKQFAVVDRTSGQKLVAALVAANEKRKGAPPDVTDRKQGRTVFELEQVEPSADTPEARERQRYELSERVRAGGLAGFLEIGAGVLDASVSPGDESTDGPNAEPADRTIIRYQSNSPIYDVFQRWADRVLNEAIVSARCAAAGLPAERVQALVRRVPVRVKGLTRRDSSTGILEDASDLTQVASLLVPAGLAALMFLVVMVGATPLMHGVVEEKMLRVAEVLLGSVQPFELMMGKLLGIMAVTLTLAGVYLAGTYWLLLRFGAAEYLPLSLIAWFVVYQTLAVLMHGSLFIAVGAACTDVKETQMLMLPVVFLICVPLFMLTHVIREPQSALSTVASLFPPGTPFLMIARQAMPGGVPAWQQVLGVLGVLATTVLFVYAAGRIFRVGLLMQGKGARLDELVRWVIRG